ncbi:MAG: competence/damage-inducible protein A, partial [Bacteroidales bacterium]|nr:competence/damage-inducible protein A [Bacteroidales bacterium]
MKAHIITIGDELLIGQVVDTNSAWMAQRLDGIGVKTIQITSVQDQASQILETVGMAVSQCDVVLITGGLGPTKDDITKSTLARFFNDELVVHQPTLENIEELFKRRGLEMTELNMRQAMVPASCKVIHNALGTAPGMWFEKNGTIIVSMPGVPFEMKNIMEEYVLPQLSQMINGRFIIHKTILTNGIGESFLSDMISNWEDELPQYMHLAYLPSPGMVRLRLTGTGEHKPSLQLAMNTEIEKLQNIIPQYI